VLSQTRWSGAASPQRVGDNACHLQAQSFTRDNHAQLNRSGGYSDCSVGPIISTARASCTNLLPRGGILGSDASTEPQPDDNIMISKIASSLLHRAARAFPAVALIALLVPASSYAGTPLICHPYVIGSAKSLPGSDGDWKGVNPSYDRTNLVRDTLALLTPETPVIVRMETLRRAAIYATAGMRGWSTKEGFTAEDRANTSILLEKLQERTKTATGPDLALALFDAGFFTETLRHTGVDRSLDGYALIAKARELRGPDAEMEFALALASSWPNKRKEHSDHVARARAGAKPNTLLAANLASHFGKS
jgi:hypothetical protein